MLLTTAQACEKLGVGKGKLMRLVRYGELIDRGVTRDGLVRHQHRFSSQDLDAYRRRLRNGSGNGHEPAQPVLPTVPEVAPEPPVGSPAVVSITRRLTAIERQITTLQELVQQLLRVWA